MNEREKIAHLYRRFGLGATARELEASVKQGLNATIDQLFDYEGTPEEFELPFWPFALDNDLNVNFDASRFVPWWTLRMLTTTRPLEQNLALFWHDHFAVSATKVTNGPMMVEYEETLRRHAAGNFRVLLGSVARDPAMIRWLDTDTSVVGHPNENFAREIMELFTLGVGHYSEKDVQEAARVFTGWAVRGSLPEAGRVTPFKHMIEIRKMGTAMFAFTEAPGLQDRGVKTIFGEALDFTPDALMDRLIRHPAHAPFMARKLWEWFAYPDPSPKVVERIANAYVKAKYEIKPTLRAILQTKEFWSDEAHRAIVKSPVAFSISLGRQLGVAEQLRAAKLTKLDPAKPVPNAVRDSANFFAGQMRRQGLTLLYPPDVAGWNWGTDWITTAGIIERRRMLDVMFRNANGALPRRLVADLNESKPTDSQTVIEFLCQRFDVPANPEQKQILRDAFDRAGGIEALGRPATAGPAIGSVMRLVAGLPEFQFC